MIANCPHCQAQLDVEGLSGEFACPHCGRPFSINPPPVSGPPVRAVTPPVRTVVPPTAPQTFYAEQAAISKRRASGTGMFNFLDLRFERYLTPIIIRIYWVMALVSAVLAFVLRGLSWVMMRTPKQLPNGQPRFEFRLPQSAPQGSTGGGTEIFYDIVSFSLLFIGLVAGLLFIRVVCETLIVLFDISTTLKEIKKQNSNLDRSRP